MNILITGGAGFIGVNAANRFKKHDVVVFDNLSKPGSVNNLKNLPKEVEFVAGDLRSAEDVENVFLEHKPFDVILHLGAQTAVTTSFLCPMTDFKTNSLGTLNILSAALKWAPGAHIIYSSTNKVYGKAQLACP